MRCLVKSVPKVKMIAAVGVCRGSWKRFFSAWTSILSNCSISDLFRIHYSALLRRVGMVIRSWSSRSTADSTQFKTSLDAIVLIVAVVARIFCPLDLIFSVFFPLLVISSPK